MQSGVFALDRRDGVAAFAIVALGCVLLSKALSGSLDFHVFYLAGQRASSGKPIYLLTDGWFPFKYLPVWAVAFSPLSMLPERLANVLFNALQLGCWTWATVLWARWLGYDIRKPTNFLILVLLSFNAISSEVSFGQVNGAMFLGATKVFEWLSGRSQKWLAAGCLVAVLCNLKLNFVLLAAFCVIRNYRSVVGMLAGALVLHAATALFFGDWLCADLYRSWIHVLLTQPSDQYLHPDAQGVLRFLLLTSPEFGQRLWLFSNVLVVLGGLAIEWQQRANPPLIAGIGLPRSI